MESDTDLLAQFDDWRAESEDHWTDWRKEARIAYAFEAGDQWTKEQKAKMEEANRVSPVFNRIKPMCEAVAGAEITNRQEVKFYPREVNDSGYADFLTQSCDYIRDEADAEDEESHAFYDTIVAGVGCIGLRPDFEDIPEGMIDYERVDMDEMGVDARAKRKNFSDARYIWRDRLMSEQEFEELYGTEVTPGGSDADPKNSEHTTFARDQYKEGGAGNDPEPPNGVTVTEWQWWEREVYYRVQAVNPMTQQVEMADLPEENYEALKSQFDDAGMGLDAVRMTRKVWRRAFVTGDTLLSVDELQSARFTYLFITGKFDRNKNMYFGLVRSLIDPQSMANKLWSIIANILDSSAKGGVIAEEDAVEDQREFEESWAAADAVSYVRPGAIGSGKLMEKPQSGYPTGYHQLMQNAVEAMPQVSGVNPEMLGLADREQAGVLEMQRRQAAYGTLSQLFDSLRRFRKSQGRLLLTMLPLLGQRLVRITGENGDMKYVQFVMQGDPNHFDVVADEAPTSPNRKQEVLAVLMQIAPLFKGAPMAGGMLGELIKYLPLPESLTTKLAQAMSQPNPQAQAQKQLQQRGAEAKVMKDQASGELDRAKAQQTMVETQGQALANQLGGFF